MSYDSPFLADPVSLQRSKHAARLLIPAAFITTAGNAFQITAAAILVFRAGHSAVAVGWLFIAVSVPQVVLSLVFGRLADRIDRKTLCVASDLISAAIAFALPVWLWLHLSTTQGSYLFSFLLACSATLFMPASNALFKERIRDDLLVGYNARYEMATNAGMLLAASTAGFLMGRFGATPLFVFNSGTFVASAALTYFIGRKPEKAAAPAAAPDGTAAAKPQPVYGPIRRLGLLYASGNINLMVANVLLTVLILGTFHQGPWLVGVVDALAGAGFIVGAACHGWIAARFPSLWIALGCSLVCCLTIVLEPANYIVLMCVIPFAGFFFVNFRIAARTMLMKASPQERVGRIFGGTQAFGLGLGIAATYGLASLAGTSHVSFLAGTNPVPLAFFALAALVGSIAVATSLSLVKPLAALQAKSAVPRPEDVLMASAVGGEPE
jgi:MFS family permease